MEPLKRKILFNRNLGKTEAPGQDDKPKPDKNNEPVVTAKKPEPSIEDKRNRSEKIIEWFGAHELISVNGICQQAGIDTSNFNKLLKFGKEIPDKILDKIEPIIKEYGY